MPRRTIAASPLGVRPTWATSATTPVDPELPSTRGTRRRRRERSEPLRPARAASSAHCAWSVISSGASMGPNGAAAAQRADLERDVRPLLPSVRAPVLVLQTEPRRPDGDLLVAG